MSETDPTTLTTQALTREVASLKELIFVRLDAMDKAIELFDRNITEFPTEVDIEIGHLRELLRAEIHTIEIRFSTLFEGVAAQFISNSTALAAALQAAEKAVAEQNKAFALSIDKSESTTTKQIDSVKAQVDDVKERTTRIESLGIGVATQKTEQATGNAAIWAIVGGFGTIIGTIIAIAAILTR